MKAGRAPDYILTQAHGELPQGAFVRPIELKWVPKDTLERLGITHFFDATKEVVCYTRHGMVLIPREKIKQV